ncbi:carbon-nitrogen hydrolase family protein [Nakamurella flava]|uniref:Carbon-nitrogen hydrolase family protein n=1 Tax=Nakamurella flava TaxID=2576308 RepID=A0A4U6QLL2_9ACTN|nr:carbon-nitrogen hydrolase family protein [Nakamurella flava]TKV61450.1 carbon-nitrogen hydrolase family protein [Nakamurella flava]
MRIAVAQIASRIDPAVNLRLVTDGIRAAADAGAALVVFPEAAMCAFGVALAPVAEPLDGPWATAVREVADEHDVCAVVGMFTPASGGRVRNTLLATGRGVETSYDKIHLYDAHGFRESTTVAPGTAPMTFTVDGVTVGLATCYDVRFPGLFQTLADRGAEVVVMPSSWGAGPGKREQWDLLTRARALDSTTFVAACDQARPATAGVPTYGTAPTGIGASIVVAPDGSMVDQLDEAPGTLVVDLDLERVAQVRAVLPVLVNRRF